MTNRLLTSSGLAAETKVPPATIRNWVRKGLINCQFDSAGRRLFSDEAIEQVVKLREVSWHERRGVAA